MELLERLEISVLNLSEVLKENDIFRFDSEFQLKEYVNSIEKLKQIKHVSFDNHIELLTDGKHGGVTLTEDGVIFLRTTNIQENKIDLSDLRYISVSESEETLRAEFKAGDLLLTTIGTIGLCAKVPDNFPRATINQNLVRIVLKDKSESSLICCFLNSKYGKKQLLRYGAGNVYQMINYPNLRKILIPQLDLIKDRIDNIYNLSELKDNQSKEKYTQAETLLLQEIGLDEKVTGLNPVEVTNTNVKNFKESFGATGRLDAEYYQKKYDVLEGKFDKFKRIKISDLVNYPISSGTTPKAGGDDYTDFENGIPFVRAVDLQNGEVSVSNFNYIKIEIHNSTLKRTQLKKNDVLLSIAGTVGRSAIFNHEFDANINQAVAILRFDETEVLRLYMVIFFNSKIGQEFVSKYSRQGVQTNLNLEEIGNLKLPVINYKKQQEIAKLIEESFSLKKQSEKLLEVAKKAVEIAIEESEEVAMKFINEKITLQ